MESSSLPGVIDLLKQSIAYYKKNYQQLIYIGLALVIVSLVGIVIKNVFTSEQALNFPLFASSFILGIISIILQITSRIAFVKSFKENESGNIMSAPDLYKSSLHIFWSFIWVAILGGLVTLGAGVFFLIPAIIVGGYVILATNALIVDDERGLNALSTSFYYIKGNWWKVFWRGLGLSLIVALISLILLVIFVLISASSGLSIFGSAESLQAFKMSIGTSPVGQILNLIYVFVFYCVIYPITSFYYYSIYKHLKASKPKPNPEVDFKTSRSWFIGLSVWSLIAGVILFFILSALILVGLAKGLQSIKNLDQTKTINYPSSYQR